MTTRTFGNLQEWDGVLKQLETLRREGALSEHQEALADVLRYHGNWRLREAALDTVRHIETPTEPLVREALNIMTDESTHAQMRMLAAEVLADVIERTRSLGHDGLTAVGREVIEAMHDLLDSPQPPVLHDAVQKVLPRVE